MNIEDIQEERNFNIKLNALCESQGIRIKENKEDPFSVRNQAKRRQQQRRKKEKV